MNMMISSLTCTRVSRRHDGYDVTFFAACGLPHGALSATSRRLLPIAHDPVPLAMTFCVSAESKRLHSSACEDPLHHINLCYACLHIGDLTTLARYLDTSTDGAFGEQIGLRALRTVPITPLDYNRDINRAKFFFIIASKPNLPARRTTQGVSSLLQTPQQHSAPAGMLWQLITFFTAVSFDGLQCGRRDAREVTQIRLVRPSFRHSYPHWKLGQRHRFGHATVSVFRM